MGDLTDTTDPNGATRSDTGPSGAGQGNLHASATGDVELVEQALRLLSALRIDDVLALVTEDFVLDLPFRHDGGRRTLEREPAERFMRALPRLLETLHLVDVDVRGPLPDGQIVAEYRSDGMTRHGTPYRNTYAAFFRVRDGRIAFWREYFDPTVVSSAFPS